MTESNFFKIYNLDQMSADLKFVRSFRNLFFIFHKYEKRVWHRSKFWGCWLRYHRFLRLKEPAVYFICIIKSRDSKEARGFESINQRDNEK